MRGHSPGGPSSSSLDFHVDLMNQPLFSLLVILVAGALGFSAPSTSEGSELVALVGARIYPVSSEPISDGVILVKDGKITAVGSSEEVKIPDGTPLVRLNGQTVIPGLIDLSTSWPLTEDPSDSFSSQTYHDVLDSLDPHDVHIPLLLKEGVTTVGLVPRTRAGLGILGGVIKLAPGRSGSTKAEKEPPTVSPPDLEIVSERAYLTLELGRVPPGLGGAASTTTDRLNQYYALRALLDSALAYRDQWKAYRRQASEYNEKLKAYQEALKKSEKGAKKDEKKPEDEKKTGTPDAKKTGGGFRLPEDSPEKKTPEKKPPEKKPEAKPPAKKPEPKPPTPPKEPRANEQLEVLLRVLDGELPVLFTAHRRDDISYALKLRKDYGMKTLAILGATEGYLQGPALREAGLPVSVSPVLLRERGLRTVNHRESNPATLGVEGVPVAISTLESGPAASRFLRWQAAVAMRGGLSASHALRAITLEAARTLGIEKRVGSLEVGKDADLVILDGDPLDIRSQVMRVMVNGRFRLSRTMEF